VDFYLEGITYNRVFGNKVLSKIFESKKDEVSE